MPNSIQPGEQSTGGGTDDILCFSDGDPNLLSANRNDDGQWLNANVDHPDNKWNDNGGFAFVIPQLSSFLSPILGRVLFCELAAPATEICTDFIDWQ